MGSHKSIQADTWRNLLFTSYFIFMVGCNSDNVDLPTIKTGSKATVDFGQCYNVLYLLSCWDGLTLGCPTYQAGDAGYINFLNQLPGTDYHVTDGYSGSVRMVTGGKCMLIAVTEKLDGRHVSIHPITLRFAVNYLLSTIAHDYWQNACIKHPSWTNGFYVCLQGDSYLPAQSYGTLGLVDTTLMIDNLPSRRSSRRLLVDVPVGYIYGPTSQTPRPRSIKYNAGRTLAILATPVAGYLLVAETAFTAIGGIGQQLSTNAVGIKGPAVTVLKSVMPSGLSLLPFGGLTPRTVMSRPGSTVPTIRTTLTLLPGAIVSANAMVRQSVNLLQNDFDVARTVINSAVRGWWAVSAGATQTDLTNGENQLTQLVDGVTLKVLANNPALGVFIGANAALKAINSHGGAVEIATIMFNLV